MKKAALVLVATGLCLTIPAPAQAARSCNSIAASFYGPAVYGSIKWMLDMFGGKYTSEVRHNDCLLF